MADPQTLTPHRSRYAAKAQRRAEQTWNPETLHAQYQEELAVAAELESEQRHPKTMATWKRKYKRDQLISFNGDHYRIAAITKRGLMLHHIPES